MIALDNSTNSGYQAASSSYNWSHTCSGNLRILVVSVALLNVANSVTSMTYNSVAFTKLRSDVDGTGTIRTEIWYILSPALGANTLAVNLNSASVSGSAATSYTGVDQFNPVDAQNGTTGTTGAGGGSASISTTVVTEGAWIVDCVATTDTSITVGAGQNQRANITGAVGSGGQSDKSVAAGAQTMQWDNVGALLNWTMSTFAMLPSTNPTTTSTSSTSASTFSTSSTSSSTSSTSSSISSTSTSLSTSSTSYSTSSTSSSISSTSSSTSSTSISSTSNSTSMSSTSSSISSTSFSSTSLSSTSSSSSISSTSSSISSTSSSTSSTSQSTSSTSFSSTSSSSSTSTTAIPRDLIYSYQDMLPPNIITLVQQVTGSLVASASSMTMALATIKAGNFMVVGVASTSTTNTVTSVSTPLNTFTLIGPGVQLGGGGAGFVTLYYCKNIVAETTPTLTVAHSGSISLVGVSAEYSGIDTVNPLDTYRYAPGATASVSTGPSSYTSGLYELVVGFAGSDFGGTSYTLGTGYGHLKSVTTNANMDCGMEDKIITSPDYQMANFVLGSATDNASGLAVFRGALAPPLTNANLINLFTSTQVSNVAADDGDYFVEYGSEYMIREYKKDWTNNVDSIYFTWRGRTTYDTRVSPMLIQIYNQSSLAWETLATANTIPADIDFSVTVSKTTNLSNYYDASNIVTFRSYQQVI